MKNIPCLMLALPLTLAGPETETASTSAANPAIAHQKVGASPQHKQGQFTCHTEFQQLGQVSFCGRLNKKVRRTAHTQSRAISHGLVSLHQGIG